MVDGGVLHGGLMLGKKLVATIPAAAYIDGERDGEKIMVWKLGREFLEREDVYWSRSFTSPENPLRATAPHDPPN